MQLKNLNPIIIKLNILLGVLSLFLLTMCNSEDPEPVEEHLIINLDSLPYKNLSEYGFFKNKINNLEPRLGVLPYDINAPLFSDYSEKERFIFLPEGTTMQFVDENSVLDFPIGSIIIKNFFYYNDARNPSQGRKLIETRLLVRMVDKWQPYVYQWDDLQTDAKRLIIGATVEANTILENGRELHIPAYVIPRELDCRTCHNLNMQMAPIGPKPNNLNKKLTSTTNQTQLQYWSNEGNLTGVTEITSPIPDYHDDRVDNHTRARSYLDANCAFCHRQGGTANANGLYINWDFDGDDLNRGIFKIPTNYNAPNLQYDIVPGKPDESILLYRMHQTTPSDIMPQIGRSLNHEEGIDIIREYILNL